MLKEQKCLVVGSGISGVGAVTLLNQMNAEIIFFDGNEKMSIEEHVEFYEKQGVDHKDALKKVAKDRGVSKRDIYQYLLK